jgi:phage terminase large subunit
MRQGARVLCGREVQKSLKESAKRLVEDKIASLQAPGFRILTDQIITPGGGVIVFQGLQEHTADTIKSYEGFDLFWIEEAHKLSQRSLDILRPTLRRPESELWFSWNPFRRSDPVDALLRGPNATELGAIVVEANWRDNPWFPDVLKAEREFDFKHSPETYEHVWEGKYATVVKGAYYAAQLAQAQRESRITRLFLDPLMEIKAFWDLGVSDYTAIWIAQFIGREIRVLDYLEGEGQPLSYYVAELRKRGYEEALCVLPHDGAQRDSVRAIKFEDHLKEAGFRVRTVSNQGAGAARLRIEAARRVFPRVWLDDLKTTSGREALGAYHEKYDDERQTGLGPEHDWSSHAADAWGLMAIAYEEPKANRPPEPERVRYYEGEEAGQAWLGN